MNHLPKRENPEEEAGSLRFVFRSVPSGIKSLSCGKVGSATENLQGGPGPQGRPSKVERRGKEGGSPEPFPLCDFRAQHTLVHEPWCRQRGRKWPAADGKYPRRPTRSRPTGRNRPGLGGDGHAQETQRHLLNVQNRFDSPGKKRSSWARVEHPHG